MTALRHTMNESVNPIGGLTLAVLTAVVVFLALGMLAYQFVL